MYRVKQIGNKLDPEQIFIAFALKGQKKQDSPQKPYRLYEYVFY